MSDLSVKGEANLYRKLPFEIEAIELAEDAVVSTLEGDMQGRVGDMLVTGVEGESYIIKRDIFDKTYELADNTCFVDLCLDFDGVIHAYISGWKGIDIIPDKPVEGAIYALYDYMDDVNNYSIAIFSARSCSMKGIDAMRGWLNTHDAEFRHNYTNGLTEYNRDRTPLQTLEFAKTLNKGWLTERIEFPTSKPAAKVYIDDRGFRFNGPVNGRFPYPAELNRAMKVWYDKE